MFGPIALQLEQLEESEVRLLTKLGLKRRANNCLLSRTLWSTALGGIIEMGQRLAKGTTH